MNNVKWSRNLSTNNQEEINRMRLIAKQKLENKRNRQQQTIITSTRQQSAKCKSVQDLNCIEYKADPENKLNSLDNISLIKNQKLPYEINVDCNNLDTFESNLKDKQYNNNLNQINLNQNLNNLELIDLNKSTDSTQSTDLNDLNNLINKNEKSNQKNNSLKSESNKSSINKTNLSESKISLNESNLKSNCNDNLSLNLNQLSKFDLNPLTSLMNNNELFNFVINPVPRNKTYQCTIIRDKKGLDRTLYPTYYMHLQAINSKKINLYQADGEQNLIDLNAENLCKKASVFSSKKDVELKQVNSNETFNNQTNDLSIRQVFLLSGRHRKKSKTYLISCDPFEITRENCIAKLKSNVLGTQFNTIRILQNNQRSDYATIIYETNVLGFKGPRKMTVLLPKNESNNYNKSLNSNTNSNLIEIFKNDPKSIIQLKNKTPAWNEETQSYVLNFRGRVTQASVKNFQLEQCDALCEEDFRCKKTADETLKKHEDHLPSTIESQSCDNFISMQFGRISNKEFTCDISWPLSILQAFSIALSSFDSKLACE